MGHYIDAWRVPPAMQDAFSDAQLVGAHLEVAAALVWAASGVGRVSAAQALSIASTCKAELFDVAKLAREGAQRGDLLPPLQADLSAAVALFNAEAAPHVPAADHPGWADAAAALTVQRASARVLADLQACADHVARAEPALAHTLTSACGHLRPWIEQACALPPGMVHHLGPEASATVTTHLGLPAYSGPALAQRADIARLAAEWQLVHRLLQAHAAEPWPARAVSLVESDTQRPMFHLPTWAHGLGAVHGAVQCVVQGQNLTGHKASAMAAPA